MVRSRLDQANSRLFLPKLGWLRYRNGRHVLGTVRNDTVSKLGGKWYASIQTEREVEQPVPQTTSAVGIDMGIARFATLSDGTFYTPLHSFERHEAALRKEQQAMSRNRVQQQLEGATRSRLEKLFPRQRREPPVSPGESRSLNKERL